ncbi:hypothetical protein LCGC14_1286450 [marine sediment metagenome]|uniref:Uncharacterized protein n=1 Tax=marine sediment metagenome TaxID=412755 RepID=A0A0F9KVE9_9ZZZZ
MKRRIKFDFDEVSFRTLDKLRILNGYSTLGESVRDCIKIFANIDEQSRKGFSEVILRNPNTGEQLRLEVDKICKKELK